MDYLILDASVSATDLSERLFQARKDPAVADPDDVTTRLVSHVTHPDTGEEAIALGDVPLPIRNPDPPDLPSGVVLPDQAGGEAGPDPEADPWHERLPIGDWGTVKTEEEMVEAGWFPETDVAT